VTQSGSHRLFTTS